MKNSSLQSYSRYTSIFCHYLLNSNKRNTTAPFLNDERTKTTRRNSIYKRNKLNQRSKNVQVISGLPFNLATGISSLERLKSHLKRQDNSLPSGNATVKAKQSLFQLMIRCIITLLLQKTNDISVSLSSQNRP